MPCCFAVVWNATPRLAEWLLSVDCVLTRANVLHSQAIVLELGCGSSGLLAILLSGSVGRYVATDQEYVLKILKRNIEGNTRRTANHKRPGPQKAGKQRSRGTDGMHELGNITVETLDWELHDATDLSRVLLQSAQADPGTESFDVVLAADCIYNEALVPPFVQACVAACKLRKALHEQPTVCVVAQQLRSHEVFEVWLKTMLQSFHVFKIRDNALPPDLRYTAGFAVHIAVLRPMLSWGGETSGML